MNRRARWLSMGFGLAALTAPLFAAQEQGFTLSVLVGGVPAPEYAGRGRVYVEALKGREFVLRLSNPTSGRIAVALSVDGRNVVDAKRTTAREAAKWVLAPGETIDVPGWQISGTTSRRFFFTETSKSYAKWLGDTANVGTIEAVFYREKLRPVPPNRLYSGKDQADAPSREAGASGAPAPRSEAQAQAREKEAKTRDAENFAATGIGERTDFPVEWVAFEPESAPAATIALRYEFQAELVRLGVYPRPEDLYARDRAHGFQHDYAPDPYRR